MKLNLFALFGILAMMALISCSPKAKDSNIEIIFLHQSTGGIIWQGTNVSFIQKVAGKVSSDLKYRFAKNALIPLLFNNYNKENNTNYRISEKHFPRNGGNHPYNYYNIWVRNADIKPNLDEPTLDILTAKYQVIILKHCYTASHIKPDQISVDINSNQETIANYKLQYTALRDKFLKYPDTKFIIFTSAVEIKSETTEDEALRTKEFVRWIVEDWDLPDDNIYLWDLYSLQTEGGLYLRDEYAISINDSHPNKEFANKSGKLLFKRVIDIIENDGNYTKLTGEEK